MRTSLRIVIVLAICAVAVLSGCQGTSSQQEPDTDKITLIISQPQGEPFANMVYGGLEKLKEEKGESLEINLIESLDKGEHKEQVRAAAEMGSDPVMVMWDDLANAALEVAPEFPDTKFIILDSYVNADLPNVQTVVIEPQESSFIAGVVAALNTETGTLGFVGHFDQPVIERFYSGFASGVKYVDPSIEIIEVYAGTATDPAKGLEVGKNVFNQGADIVMHAANKTGLGVIQAAEETGNQAIGVDMWQGDVAPGHVLWSALKDAGTATYLAAKRALEGEFETGVWVYDRKAGATLYDERDFSKVDEQTQRAVEHVEERLNEGSLTVPATKDEVAEFDERIPDDVLSE